MNTAYHGLRLHFIPLRAALGAVERSCRGREETEKQNGTGLILVGPALDPLGSRWGWFSLKVPQIAAM